MAEELILEKTEKVLEILNDTKEAMKNVKEITPLTHCITNFVTVNDCANAALAVGGSPIMADDSEEVAEVVDIANVLVINIGKLSETQVDAIRESSKHANKIGKPIVVDPVGAGISGLRNRVTKELVEDYKLAAIRGNMSEIKAIAKLINLDVTNNDGNEAAGKGVDVAESDIISKDNLDINGLYVKELAKELDTVIIASGPIDIISDGEYTFGLENGDEMMPLITGSGCMLTTIIGSYVGANDALIGSITASALMAIAGEKAAEYVRANDLGTGSFRTFLIDNLYKTDAEEISKRANLFEINI